MPKLTIYGCSDDLIEIEGDITEELNPGSEVEDDGTILAISDGTLLRVKYDGIWRITTITKGASVLSKEEAPEDDDDNYSDRVTLEGPQFNWVALGSSYASR